MTPKWAKNALDKMYFDCPDYTIAWAAKIGTHSTFCLTWQAGGCVEVTFSANYGASLVSENWRS